MANGVQSCSEPVVEPTPQTEALLHTKSHEHARMLVEQPKVSLANLFAVWIWLGWIANYWISAVVGCALTLCGWYKACGVLVALYAMLIAVPRHAGVERFGGSAGKWIISRAVEYFALRVVYVDESSIRDAGTPMIFAIEPHDVLPVSMAVFHFSLDWIPGHVCSGLMTSAVFNLPGMKSIFSLLSAEKVDRGTFGSLLDSGRSCCFCPGGVQEVMHLQHDREVVLFLNARLGFARIALKHRSPVRSPCAHSAAWHAPTESRHPHPPSRIARAPNEAYRSRPASRIACPRSSHWLPLAWPLTARATRAALAFRPAPFAGRPVLHVWPLRHLLPPLHARQVRGEGRAHDRLPTRRLLGRRWDTVRPAALQASHCRRRQASAAA
jgi:hypothetical protein